MKYIVVYSFILAMILTREAPAQKQVISLLGSANLEQPGAIADTCFQEDSLYFICPMDSTDHNILKPSLEEIMFEEEGKRSRALLYAGTLNSKAPAVNFRIRIFPLLIKSMYPLRMLFLPHIKK